MSHSSKVDFPAKARSMGFRTYLYFVALDSPEINRYRVSTRVAEGGHDVPDDKIANRYERSLRFATEVLKHADRAFLFDNSGSSPLLVGERLTNGIFEHRVPSAQLPRWFKKYILS